MKNLHFKSLFQSEIVRNSSVLLSGNILGQGITFLFYPILTRIYSEADFGVFALFTSVCTLLTTIATGRYEESLVVAKNRKETANLLGFSIKWLSLFSIVLLVVLAFFRKPVLQFFEMSKIEVYWVYIPFTVFISGLLFLLNNLANREKKYKLIASSNVVKNTVNTTFRLLTGLFAWTGIGLILSNLVALFVSAFPYRTLNKSVIIAMKGKWKEEKYSAWQYKAFPVFNLSRTFLSSFSTNLPILYLIGFFDEKKIGLYSMAFIVIYTPISLITNSLFSTFFENITSCKREGKSIFPLLKTYCKSICIYILPFFILASFIAEPLFRIVLGAKWEESGIYFRYLLPWMFLLLATAPLNSIFIIFNKQNKTLWLEVFYLLLRWLALYTGIHFINFSLGILLFSMTGVLFSMLSLIWIYVIIRNYTKNIGSIP
ncbi:MAG: oligosaccharide flippase family protein [Dysgonamonadaceae bacterium]|jgi:O-antigen/teichoic acid export membrane protein|nr:oligosaccharide flippase family protein [Dysgonamonadaceae bacterium]